MAGEGGADRGADAGRGAGGAGLVPAIADAIVSAIPGTAQQAMPANRLAEIGFKRRLIDVSLTGKY